MSRRKRLKESDLIPTLFRTGPPVFAKEKPHIHPSDIEVKELYRQLENIAFERGPETGSGYRDGTQCPFDRTDVYRALGALGIQEQEMAKALHYCIEVDFLHQRGEFYHLDRSHLAFYRRASKHNTECS